MLTITLTEPWATLVADGWKRVETRSWATDYRGPLAIHASKKMTSGDLAHAERFVADYDGALMLPVGESGKIKDAFTTTRGCVIATASLVGCYPTERVIVRDTERDGSYLSSHGQLVITDMEHGFGNYEPGRWAWLLADVRRLPRPVLTTGALGLWEWDEHLGTRIREEATG